MFGASPGEETAAVGFEISRFHVCAPSCVCVCATAEPRSPRFFWLPCVSVKPKNN